MNDMDCQLANSMVAEWCEKELIGWSYWQFKNYKDFTTISPTEPEGFYQYDGSTKDIMLRPLTRPYVQLAQGII